MKRVFYAIGVWIEATALVFAGVEEKEALGLIPDPPRR